jgi:hypothetical protein
MTFYALYALYAWWIYFPQSGAPRTVVLSTVSVLNGAVMGLSVTQAGPTRMRSMLSTRSMRPPSRRVRNWSTETVCSPGRH